MSGQPGTNRGNAPPPLFCPSPTKEIRMLMAQSSSPPQDSSDVVDVDVDSVIVKAGHRRFEIPLASVNPRSVW